MKQIRKRLTYANVMSSLAVFLILGGATAFAATKIGTKDLKAGAVTTGKIKKEAVKAGKIAKEAVKTSKIGKDAVTGEKVNESTLGEVPKAAIGSPAAYALLTVGGGINEGEPFRGLVDANVTYPETGVYCVDLAFAPKTGAGHTVSQGAEDGIVSLELGAPFNTCPPTVDAEVRVYDANIEGEDDEDVWAQFDS